MDHAFFNPDGWMDVVAYVVIGAPALVAAVGVFVGQRKSQIERTVIKDSAEQILFEVRNEHRTNLRDDIDAVSDSIQSGFAEVRRDVRHLREELRTERIERIEGDKPR